MSFLEIGVQPKPSFKDFAYARAPFLRAVKSQLDVLRIQPYRSITEKEISINSSYAYYTHASLAPNMFEKRTERNDIHIIDLRRNKHILLSLRTATFNEPSQFSEISHILIVLDNTASNIILIKTADIDNGLNEQNKRLFAFDYQNWQIFQVPSNNFNTVENLREKMKIFERATKLLDSINKK